LGAGVRIGSAIFPGIPSGGGGRGCLPQVGAGVSVGKFLAVTLNGARAGVQVANVIIFLARDGPVTSTPIFDLLRLAYSGLPLNRRT